MPWITTKEPWTTTESMDPVTMRKLACASTREEYCRILNRWLRKNKLDFPNMEVAVKPDGHLGLVPRKKLKPANA